MFQTVQIKPSSVLTHTNTWKEILFYTFHIRKTELPKFYRACGKYRYMKLHRYGLFDCKIVHKEVQIQTQW